MLLYFIIIEAFQYIFELLYLHYAIVIGDNIG